MDPISRAELERKRLLLRNRIMSRKGDAPHARGSVVHDAASVHSVEEIPEAGEIEGMDFPDERYMGSGSRLFSKGSRTRGYDGGSVSMAGESDEDVQEECEVSAWIDPKAESEAFGSATQAGGEGAERSGSASNDNVSSGPTLDQVGDWLAAHAKSRNHATRHMDIRSIGGRENTVLSVPRKKTKDSSALPKAGKGSTVLERILGTGAVSLRRGEARDPYDGTISDDHEFRPLHNRGEEFSRSRKQSLSHNNKPASTVELLEGSRARKGKSKRSVPSAETYTRGDELAAKILARLCQLDGEAFRLVDEFKRTTEGYSLDYGELSGCFNCINVLPDVGGELHGSDGTLSLSGSEVDSESGESLGSCDTGTFSPVKRRRMRDVKRNGGRSLLSNAVDSLERRVKTSKPVRRRIVSDDRTDSESTL